MDNKVKTKIENFLLFIDYHLSCNYVILTTNNQVVLKQGDSFPNSNVSLQQHTVVGSWLLEETTHVVREKYQVWEPHLNLFDFETNISGRYWRGSLLKWAPHGLPHLFFYFIVVSYSDIEK